MKLKNVEIGMRVQVKEKQGDLGSVWYSESEGEIGEVISVDRSGHPSSVELRFNAGRTEWGTHEGLRKVKESKQIDVNILG